MGHLPPHPRPPSTSPIVPSASATRTGRARGATPPMGTADRRRRPVHRRRAGRAHDLEAVTSWPGMTRVEPVRSGAERHRIASPASERRSSSTPAPGPERRQRSSIGCWHLVLDRRLLELRTGRCHHVHGEGRRRAPGPRAASPGTARRIRRRPGDRRPVRRSRRRLDQAAITTLHGFARASWPEHPVEAGLPPRSRSLDEVSSGSSSSSTAGTDSSMGCMPIPGSRDGR